MNTNPLCLTVVPLVLALGCATTSEPPAKHATFEVRQEIKVKVPEGAERMRIWVALPQQGSPAQKVSDLHIDAGPYPTRKERDSEGNEQLYLEITKPDQKEIAIVQTFTLDRDEVRSGVSADNARPLTERERQDLAAYLQPDANVVIDDRIRKLAGEIVGDEQNPVRAARKIYDWTLKNIDYWVKDPDNKAASKVGSSEHCLNTRTGNCTDFHSLWASLARASGIPTRIVYGSFLKKELDGTETDQSYHCWPVFYAGGIGWVPHDVAVADIFVGDFAINEKNGEKVRRTTADGYSGAEPAKVEYYFGNLDERRVTWSVGRDLLLSPRQDGGPVNALVKAYVEVDGKPWPEGATGWTRKLTFRERKS